VKEKKTPIINPKDPKSYLPLTAAELHVLLALADGDKHGYAIKKEVARLTDGQIRLGPGTLYGLIKRLLNAGIITESADRPIAALDDERRHYYRLTDFGALVLREELARLEQMLATARAKNILGKPVPA